MRSSSTAGSVSAFIVEKFDCLTESLNSHYLTLIITGDVSLEVDVEKSVEELNVCHAWFFQLLVCMPDKSDEVQSLGPRARCRSNHRFKDFFAIHSSMDVNIFIGAGRMCSEDCGHFEGCRFPVKL